jgi:signal transduction histidine kinase
LAAVVGRPGDLTRQLLAFARRQVFAPVPVDLNALARDSEKLLRRVLGEDVELLSTLQPDLWRARCDPGQIEQVILNLAVNACDAMPAGGKLTIETSNVAVDEAEGGPVVERQPEDESRPDHAQAPASCTAAGIRPRRRARTRTGSAAVTTGSA